MQMAPSAETFADPDYSDSRHFNGKSQNNRHAAGDQKDSADNMVRALQQHPMGSLTDSTTVSSVYFDDPDFQTYQSRLLREDGASVVRVRWYGARSQSGLQELYVERKVHKEPWTGERSFKVNAHRMHEHLPGLLSCLGKSLADAVMYLHTDEFSTLSGNSQRNRIAGLSTETGTKQYRQNGCNSCDIYAPAYKACIPAPLGTQARRQRKYRSCDRTCSFWLSMLLCSLSTQVLLRGVGAIPSAADANGSLFSRPAGHASA